METQSLIQELTDITHSLINDAKALKKRPQETLNAQPESGKWSALECLEHLNRYGDFYLPEIKTRLDIAKQEPTTTYTPGILGNYFVNAVKPKARNMNTFDSMNPSNSSVRPDIVNEFIQQQEDMLLLLDRCKEYNLKKIKTNISISTWIKLRLGDTLRVVIYHNQRHMEQAQRALQATSKNEKAAV